MSNSIHHLINQFNLQTKLFKNVTRDLTNDQSVTQMNLHTNHAAWLAGHIVSTRFMIANAIGLQEKEPFPDLFANGKGRDDEANYPTMSELLAGWDLLADKIAERLDSLDEETLRSTMPRPVPTGDTLADLISFILHHEAYTIGQLGILRRFFGLEAMKYG